MGAIKPKAASATIILALLALAWAEADDARPNLTKIQKCRMLCALKCFPGRSPLYACNLKCMTDCMGRPAAIVGCNLGCVVSSCFGPDSGAMNMKGCAGSCSKDCEASYVAN